MRFPQSLKGTSSTREGGGVARCLAGCSGTDEKYYTTPIRSVKLLGYDGELQWKQEADGLAITYLAEMPFATAVTFRIE